MFVDSFFFSASGNYQKDAAYVNIKNISLSRISLKNLIAITQVSWNAINIHNSKDCLLTLYFLFSHFGNNRAAFMDIYERRPLTIINMDLLRFFVLGKKATVINSSSSHLNCHPIVSLIVIPSSRSAKKTLLVLPCVSLLVTSLN